MTTEQVKGAKQISAYPLTWPVGWKRTLKGHRSQGRFNTKETKSSFDPALNKHSYWKRTRDLTIADAVGRVLDQLRQLGINPFNVVISTNIEARLDGLPRSGKEAEDPGVAVYWRDKGNQQKCMAIDRYTRVADNIAAIAATIEAMRAIERHGGAEILERAFLGFQALPAPDNEGPWCEVLGFENYVDIETAEERYRELAKKYHPDRGGDAEKFKAITRAIAQARATVG